MTLNNYDEDANKWSNLLPDLLCLIVSEFDDHKDLLTFRSVCKSWCTVAMADASLTPFSPLLLAPYDKSDNVRKFHYPSHSSLTVAIPESVGKLIIGTAHGFLILLSKNSGNVGSGGELLVSLFNPITRSHIHLPTLHLHENRCSCLSYFKALLSSHPCSNPPPMIAVWADDKLYFLALGDDHWRSPHCTGTYNSYGVFAYYRGSFFLGPGFKIKVIDAQSLESYELDVPLEEEHMSYCSQRMIVFSGDLVLALSNDYEFSPKMYKAYATFKLVKENIGHSQSQSRWRWSKEDYSSNKCTAFFLNEYLSVAVASPYLSVCKIHDIYNGFSYYCESEERMPDGKAYTLCTADFNLPFKDAYEDLDAYECVNDQMWNEFEDSDAEEEYWSSYYHNYRKKDVSSMKKVRRCKDGTVCTWFIPNPH